jgi:hypothetical protein
MTRSALLAATLFSATAPAALAEVCDKERPSWNPADGPVGAWGEMVANLLSVPGLVVLTIAILAHFSKSMWVPLALSLLPFALAWLIHFGHNDPLPWAAEMRAHARQEGCIGPPELAITLFVVIGIGLLARAALLHRARITP